MIVTANQLLAAAPHAQPHIVSAIADHWDEVSAKYGITNRNRAIGFLSTAYEESGGFTVLSENLNYSAARAAQVFPRLFPTAAAAQPYAYNPQAFANRVYGSRMGNVGPNDGWLYRGQGLIQITGHDNFAALAKATGLPLLDAPAMATSDEHMLECSIALFVMYPGILDYCDAQNWQAVWALVGSGRANGPVINLQNHLIALAAIERALPADAPAAASLPSLPTDRKDIQRRLNAAGATPEIDVDGFIGKETETAIEAFQRSRGLIVDGIVGPETWAALEAATS